MPSAAVVLETWEAGEREHAIDRALTILEAFTGEPRSALATLAVHKRDSLLLASRILCFGSRLEGLATCPACACETEVEMILQAPHDSLVDGRSIDVKGTAIAIRVPNSRDLAAAAQSVDSLGVLRSRCVDGAALDDDTFARVDSALEELCRPATIEIDATCPSCRAQIAPEVDIAGIFWSELSSFARRLLDDVDTLAGKYGWSEAQILSLSDVRRRRYVQGAW